MSSSVSGPTLASCFCGLYRRVAKRLGFDPSYVSRVARGERSNAQVVQVLQTETQRLLGRNHQARSNAFPETDRMLEVQRIKDSVKLAKVQLDTALVLLEMAAHAGLTWERKQRSLQGANRIYKTAERLLRQVRLTTSDAREIQKKLKEFELLSHEV